MRKRWIGVMAGCVLVAGLVVTAEEDVAWSDVPAVVQKVLSSMSKGAPIKEIEKETKGDIVYYEGEWVVDGKEAEAVVTADGDLVELEEEVDASTVPARVRAVAEKEFGAGAKVEYEKILIVVYEMEARVDGKEKEIKVLPTGEIVGRDADDDDGEDDDDDYDDDDDDEDDG